MKSGFPQSGDVTSVPPFLKNDKLIGLIDMTFAPDGIMYLLEYDSPSLYSVEYTWSCKMDGSTALASSSPLPAPAFKSSMRPIWVPASGRVALPLGMHVYNVYNARGKRLWMSNQISSNGKQA